MNSLNELKFSFMTVINCKNNSRLHSLKKTLLSLGCDVEAKDGKLFVKRKGKLNFDVYLKK